MTNVRPETMKLLGESKGSIFFFLDMSPQAMEKRAKVNKWGCTKLKSFYVAKEAIDKMKICPPEREDIFPLERTYFQMIYLTRG